jgi:hypothetical protein
MAQPDIIRGTYFSLLMGDGAGSEVFTALCGITTRDFTQTANTSDSFVRDCADPENVPIRRLIVTGKQWSISGSGDMNRADLARINAAHGFTKNYRYLFSEPSSDEVYQGYYHGPAILTSIKITGGDDAYAKIDLTLESDGEWLFTEVTP